MASPETDKPVILSVQEIENLIVRTVNKTLTQLGIEYDDPLEMQRDFQHLRDWRLSMERIKKRTLISTVWVVVAGVLAALWLGFKQLVAE